jgi:hypothetical protein
MAFQMRVNESTSLGGRSASSRTLIEGEGLASKEVTVAAAKVGQLTTRTDNETGTLTMSSGHGITTGQIIDLYWDGGSRRGITVGTVATNSVPIGADDSGEGDNLPTNLTAITACVRQEEALAVVGNNVVAIEYYADRRGTITFADGSDAELAASIDGLGLNQERSQLWYETRNATNPLAGDTVAKVFFSNGDSTGSATLRVQCLYN